MKKLFINNKFKVLIFLLTAMFTICFTTVGLLRSSMNIYKIIVFVSILTVLTGSCGLVGFYKKSGLSTPLRNSILTQLSVAIGTLIFFASNGSVSELLPVFSLPYLIFSVTQNCTFYHHHKIKFGKQLWIILILAILYYSVQLPFTFISENPGKDILLIIGLILGYLLYPASLYIYSKKRLSYPIYRIIVLLLLYGNLTVCFSTTTLFYGINIVMLIIFIGFGHLFYLWYYPQLNS